MGRRALMAIGVVATLALSACGGDEEQPQAVSLDDGHLVVVRGLRVVGPLAELIEVHVISEQAVIFPVGGPAQFHLEVRASEDVNLSRLPFHRGVAEADAGGGVLGHRGVCGQGWDEHGQPDVGDPCPAADPATQVAGGSTAELPIFLHRRTDTGGVASGAYRLVVPLDETSNLELDLELRPVRCMQGPATTAVGMAGGGEYTCELE
jgi:hypothetical protein